MWKQAAVTDGAQPAANSSAGRVCVQCGAGGVAGAFFGQCGDKASSEPLNEIVVTPTTEKGEDTRPQGKDFMRRGDPRFR